jgi:hypothetical protein
VVIIEEEKETKEVQKKKPSKKQPNSTNAGAAMDTGDVDDRHPEKRLKAAFSKFEDERLPELKKEYPNMKFT